MNRFLQRLETYDIILASRSSRRHALLRQLDIRFRVAALDVKESFPANMPVHDVAEHISRQKMDAFPLEKISPNTLLITADTIVAVHETILGKPSNEKDAFNMLKMLSNGKSNVSKAGEIISPETLSGTEANAGKNDMDKSTNTEMNATTATTFLSIFHLLPAYIIAKCYLFASKMIIE